jgi:hypothetical protein
MRWSLSSQIPQANGEAHSSRITTAYRSAVAVKRLRKTIARGAGGSDFDPNFARSDARPW